MSQYILINRIQVQNANAIAGFTWGFPAITHFLGFSHNLSRKLKKINQKEEFKGINLGGCVVVSHNTQVHTYGEYDKQFTQTRNPVTTKKSAQKLNSEGKTPSVIEEGKMNMTVSLLIEYSGNIGNRKDEFLEWIKNSCYLQRLAGGTILDIKNIQLFGLDDKTIHQIKCLLLPGFVLMDRANYLEEHYLDRQKENSNIELFDAWLDFIALKQKARPKSDLINKHFIELDKDNEDNKISKTWNKHLEKPYEQEKISKELIEYFNNDKFDKKLSEQWKDYYNPNEKTDANWEYLPRPQSGYLVPIMTGYKAISKVYENSEIQNTRDGETDVCFVESVHSIGEWLGAHKLTIEELKSSVWNYSYEENWYLCKQGIEARQYQEEQSENSDDGY